MLFLYLSLSHSIHFSGPMVESWSQINGFTYLCLCHAYDLAFYRIYFGSLFAGSFRRLLDHHHHRRRQIEINYECFIMSVMIMLHFSDKEINKVCVIFGGFSLSILPADLPNNEQHTLGKS